MEFDINFAYILGVLAMVLGSTVFFFAHNLSVRNGK